MPNYTIDPTQFTEAPSCHQFKSLLMEILDNAKGPYYARGKYILNSEEFGKVEITLTHDLLLRQREGIKSVKTDMRIEVLNPKLMGSGGLGNVYESLGVLMPEKKFVYKQKSVNNSRVCKIIPFNTGSTKEGVKSESSYSKMNHLLHCKKAVFDDKNGYIVMRKAQKEELYNFLYTNDQHRSTLTIKQRLQLCYHILKSVKEQVHDLGLIHNDLKSENMIFDFETMTLVIIDYATAQKIGDKVTCSCSTTEYLAPETLKYGSRTIQSDVFAVGLIIAEIWGDLSGNAIKNITEPHKLLSHHKNRVWSTMFDGITEDPEIQINITKIINGLTQFVPQERMSLEIAMNLMIELIKDNDETRVQSKVPISKSSNLFLHKTQLETTIDNSLATLQCLTLK